MLIVLKSENLLNLRACPGIALILTFTYKRAAPDAHTHTRTRARAHAHARTRLTQTTNFTEAVTPDILTLQQLSVKFHVLCFFTLFIESQSAEEVS